MTNFQNDFHKKRFKKHLKNFFKVPEDELEKVKILYELEHEWWGKIKPFETDQDIEKAFQNGKLVKINIDENIKPIMRLLNPELTKWPPYLLPETADLLKKIGEEWGKRLNKEGVSKDIKLSITSLTRSSEY
ncbi:MAG: DUF5715 family protein, partial [Candidatus Paceibacterota bacterium]